MEELELEFLKFQLKKLSKFFLKYYKYIDQRQLQNNEHN
jgi:hypothetical protein